MTELRRSWAILIVSLVGGIAALAVVWYMSVFQIIDLDVWWHIAAGRIMRATGTLIAEEPFAYTRAGQPYLARYEWLAQIILSAVYDAAGSRGIIVLRTALLSVAFLPVLLLRPRRAWLVSALVMYGILGLRPAILDRPQLFTFALFSLDLWLMSAWLDARIPRRTFLLTAVFLQLLWVNLHGGAALVGLAIGGTLLFHCAIRYILDQRSLRGIGRDPRVQTAALLLLLLSAATLASPNAIGNLTYTFTLFTDRTTQFIHEFAPRDTSAYLRWILPAWILGAAAVLLDRRHASFTLPLLLAFGILSRMALRHEPFFLLTALHAAAFALGRNGPARIFPDAAERRLWPCAVFVVLAFGLLASAAVRVKQITVLRHGWGGLGAFEPLGGAAGFLEREGVEGRMFNTYEAGGYLLFRGRQVFVDGRNVDHGFAFLRDYFAAGNDAVMLRSLENRYGFSYAVLRFDYVRGVRPLPYVALFEQFPDWNMVYIDDTAAVYVRRREHGALAARATYAVLTPQILLEPGPGTARLDPSASKDLEREMLRAEREAPTASLRIRLARAALYLKAGALPEAAALTETAREEAPGNVEVLNVLAMVRAAEGRPGDAAALLEEAVWRAGGDKGASVNPEEMARLWTLAGEKGKARKYLRKAE